MTTYQVFRDNSQVKRSCSITEAYTMVPAGSKMISGNTSKEVICPNGKIETITEIRAHFQCPAGGTITIIQNPP